MILLIGNWKMAPAKPSQVADLAKKTSLIAKKFKKTLTTIVCVPSVHISSAIKYARVPLVVGAQDAAPVSEVPHTGLVSAEMLAGSGVKYCIVGHSESRARGQSNEHIAQVVARLLEKKIRPIVCVGEKDRDMQGWYLSEIKEQLESALQVVPKNAVKQLVIAYEPVWAIGKDAVREATPVECREMVMFIRKVLTDFYDDKTSKLVPILYGGSVNEINAKAFIADGDAQGFLVGRVSLEPKRFAQLAQSIS